MSKQAALTFIDRMETDASLRQKLSGHIDLTGLLNVAEQSGLPFTVEDWRDAVRETLAVEGELKETELDQVAGGLNFTQNYLIGLLRSNPGISQGIIVIGG